MNNEFKSGLSRRSFMRTIGAASVAATSLPAFAALQQAPAAGAAGARGQGRRAGGAAGAGGGDFGGSTDPDMVKISSNENPLGPSDLARWAIASVGAEGGRYNRQYQQQPVTLLSEQFGLKPGYAMLYPGSGGALDLAVYSTSCPGKDLVVGEPSYEQGASAGAKMKATVHRVPLTPTGAHDVKAMLAASKNIGALLHLQPQQPDRHHDPEGGHRLAREQQARRFGCDRRRGLSPLLAR